MLCNHTGEQVGQVIHKCCNGREERYQLFRCLCEDNPVKLCQSIDPSGLTPIEIDGVRDVVKTVDCRRCPLASFTRPPESATVRAWKEQRERLAKPVKVAAADAGVVTEVLAPQPEGGRSAKLWRELRQSKQSRELTDEERLVFAVDEVFRYEPPKQRGVDGPIRHMAFHICPFSANDIWRVSLERIRQWAWLFNGRRRVAVAVGDNTASADVVRSELGSDFEVVELPNIPSLREVASFHELIGPLVNEPGVIWYGHSKGGTHHVNSGETAHRWARTCMELTLDFWPFAEIMLRRNEIVGPFRKFGGFAGSKSKFHFSGTFFWVHTESLRARDWRRIDRTWWGVESWPGIQFAPEQSGCIFGGGKAPTLDLYSQQYWFDHVWPAYQEWRQSHEHWRLR